MFPKAQGKIKKMLLFYKIMSLSHTFVFSVRICGRERESDFFSWNKRDAEMETACQRQREHLGASGNPCC
jgi:hypothetical protein